MIVLQNDGVNIGIEGWTSHDSTIQNRAVEWVCQSWSVTIIIHYIKQVADGIGFFTFSKFGGARFVLVIQLGSSYQYPLACFRRDTVLIAQSKRNCSRGELRQLGNGTDIGAVGILFISCHIFSILFSFIYYTKIEYKYQRRFFAKTHYLTKKSLNMIDKENKTLYKLM